MAQFTVEIPENQIKFFTELMKNLNISLKELEVDDLSVPEWHKNIVRERTNDYIKNDYQEWNIVQEKLDKKYGIKDKI
jgi:hypothetical protein